MKNILIYLLALMALVSSAAGVGNYVNVVNNVNPNLNGGDIEADISITNTDLLTGDGNDLEQYNEKTANNYGTGSIIQNQNFYRLVTGDYNTLIQSNYANAENYGYDNIIVQTQDDFATILGSYNYLNQYNDAIASILYGDGNYLSQEQYNAAVLTGDSNTINQENNAFAEIYGYYNVLGQQQDNDAVQDGYGNTINQQNNIESVGYVSGYDEYYDGYYYYNLPISYEYLAPGAQIYGDWNQATQVQGNSAAQVGNYNNMQQVNDASASVSGLSNVVYQEQSNDGLQDGESNYASQLNSLINRNLESYYRWGSNGTSWWNSYWSADTPVPGALVYGEGNGVTQAQGNAVVQEGTSNSAGQGNYAYGQTVDYGTVSNSIIQNQFNSLVQGGEGNNANQLNNLVRYMDQYDAGDNWWYYNWYPASSAQVSSGYYDSSLGNGIFQTQSNDAAQVGTYNWVYQNNDAFASHSNPDYGAWYSAIEQDQSNSAVMEGDGNSLYQDNIAEAYNNGDDNLVLQTEANMALIAGTGNFAGEWYYGQGQWNYQYASPDPAIGDGNDQIDQSAINDLAVVGTYDSAYQNNNQYAYQNYYAESYLSQFAYNANLVMSEEIVE